MRWRLGAAHNTPTRLTEPPKWRLGAAHNTPTRLTEPPKDNPPKPDPERSDARAGLHFAPGEAVSAVLLLKRH